MRRILVIDDEPKIMNLIGEMLSEAGYSVECCTTGAQAREHLTSEIFDLMITDVRLPDASGVELLTFAKKIAPTIQVILITAYGTIGESVQAMKAGAFDYILKPFEMDALRILAQRALERIDLSEQLRVLQANDRRERGIRQLVGDSPTMQQVQKLIKVVAPTPSTVLIQGESGTGKELVAETIHQLSQAQADQRPLVRVNCLAIPSQLMESELFGHVKGAYTGATESHKGLFELADRGTLFLDEVADLPIEMQGKLLRALEEQRIVRVGSGKEISVQVRLIAATNVDLRQRVDQGQFRDDLFYRLNVFPIHLPALTQRRADIPALATSLLTEIATKLGRHPRALTPSAMDALMAYHWPGNVRELRNILERASILAGPEAIDSKHLPTELFDSPHADPTYPTDPNQVGSFVEKIDEYKAQLILSALRDTAWVKKEAAHVLGLSPRALSHYISKYQLDQQKPE